MDVAGVDWQPTASESADAADIARLIARAAQGLRAKAADQLAQHALSDVRLAVLQVLDRSEPQGCTQVHLARTLGLSQSNVSGLVERMRNDGLLERLSCATDRRKHTLRLAVRGRQLLDETAGPHERRMARMLAGLSPEAREVLPRVLRQLLAVLDGPEHPAPGTAATCGERLPAAVFSLTHLDVPRETLDC